MRRVVAIGGLLLLITVGRLQGQEVNWLSFNQLDSALAVEPRPVFLDFYTSWCTFCRKMDKEVFVKPEVAQKLNQDYYAVKMDAETREVISFDGQRWSNQQATDKRDGIHDLAMLLASQKGEFAPPTMLFLNKDFEVEARYFEYLSSKTLLKYLKRYQD